MKEFVTAARDTLGEVDEKSALTFKHDDKEVTFYEPSDGQLALMMAMGRRDMDAKTAGTFISLFFEMMEPETQRYFENRLLDRHDTFNLSGEGGILDIFQYLGEEWGARPTKRPSDYQKSQRSTGRASTGSTRAKASTSSRSRSRASSQ